MSYADRRSPHDLDSPRRRTRARAPSAALWLAIAAGCSSEGAASPNDAALPDAGAPNDAAHDAAPAPTDAGPEPVLPPEDVPQEEFRGGTRLKARFMESEDGLRYFLGFWDEQLEIECDFAPRAGRPIVPERERHCLPLQHHSRRVYLDPSCAGEEFVEAWYASEPPRLIPLGRSDSCEEREVFELGEAVDQDVTRYANDPVRGCGQVGAEGVVHRIGKRREAAEFARARRVFAGAGQLRAQYWLGEDGSIERTGFHDAVLDVGCHAEYDQDGMLRCLPARTRPWSPERSAGSCEGVLAAPPECPGAPEYVFISQSQGDAFWHTIYRLEGRMTEGACALEPEYWAYERAVELPGSIFAPLSFAEVGGSRLVTRAVAHAAFEPYITGIDNPTETDGLHDKELAAECAPLLGADGIRRCLPGRELWYADAQCTVPAALDAGGEHALRFLLALDRTDPAAPHYRVFERGAELASSAPLFAWTDQGCARETWQGSGTPFQAGAELAPSMFVAIDEVRR